MSPRQTRPEWWEYHPEAKPAYLGGVIVALLVIGCCLLAVLL